MTVETQTILSITLVTKDMIKIGEKIGYISRMPIVHKIAYGHNPNGWKELYQPISSGYIILDEGERVILFIPYSAVALVAYTYSYMETQDNE
jgi:hypothetical protein